MRLLRRAAFSLYILTPFPSLQVKRGDQSDEGSNMMIKTIPFRGFLVKLLNTI
jgi:hypothetical protein